MARRGASAPGRRAGALLAAGLALALTACGSGSGSGGGAPEPGKDYHLLAVLPTSGPIASVGNLTVAALQVAAEQINATGGIKGSKMVVDVADDQGDPTRSVSVLQERLRGDTPPDAVYAGATSNATLAMLPILTSEQVLNIGTTSATEIGDATKYPYSFRPTPPTTVYSDWIVSILRSKGIGSVGILNPKDANGQTVAASYETALKAAGIPFTREEYVATDLDMTGPIGRLNAARPDVVLFSAGNPAALPVILDGRAKLGVTTPYWADFTVGADIANLVPKAQLDGVSLATYKLNILANGQSNPPELQTFITELAAKTNIQSYLVNPTLAFDAALLLQAASKTAPSLSADDMKAALESHDLAADEDFLTHAGMRFTTTSHFNQGGSPEDYAILENVGPRVNGQFTGGGGV